MTTGPHIDNPTADPAPPPPGWFRDGDGMLVAPDGSRVSRLTDDQFTFYLPDGDSPRPRYFSTEAQAVARVLSLTSGKPVAPGGRDGDILRRLEAIERHLKEVGDIGDTDHRRLLSLERWRAELEGEPVGVADEDVGIDDPAPVAWVPGVGDRVKSYACGKVGVIDSTYDKPSFIGSTRAIPMARATFDDGTTWDASIADFGPVPSPPDPAPAPDARALAERIVDVVCPFDHTSDEWKAIRERIYELEGAPSGMSLNDACRIGRVEWVASRLAEFAAAAAAAAGKPPAGESLPPGWRRDKDGGLSHDRGWISPTGSRPGQFYIYLDGRTVCADGVNHAIYFDSEREAIEAAVRLMGGDPAAPRLSPAEEAEAQRLYAEHLADIASGRPWGFDPGPDGSEDRADIAGPRPDPLPPGWASDPRADGVDVDVYRHPSGAVVREQMDGSWFAFGPGGRAIRAPWNDAEWLRFRGRAAAMAAATGTGR